MLTNLNLKITLVLVLAYSAFAQQDSVVNTKHADFTLFKTYVVKYRETNQISTMKEMQDAENIKSLTFLDNDSLILRDYKSNLFRTHLNSIADVKYKKGGSYWAGGMLLGAGIGTILGAFIGDVSEPPGAFHGLATMGGAFVGFLSGAVIGTIIGAFQFKYETLDLLNIADNNKKAELIQFIRQRR